jgi:hypothetical protein
MIEPFQIAKTKKRGLVYNHDTQMGGKKESKKSLKKIKKQVTRPSGGPLVTNLSSLGR